MPASLRRPFESAADRRSQGGAFLAMLIALVFATTGKAATTNASGEGTGESGTAFSTLIQAGEANLFTGTLTHSVPLVVPPGREMVTPDLKLVYSSDGQEGPFGLGWSLPFLGTVERTTKFGVPRCSAHTNEFTLHLAGGSSELRETSAGSGVYRLETDESFTEARLVNADVSNQKKWIVTERSGLEYTFGDVSSARLFKNLDQIWDYNTQTTIPTCELTTVWALTNIRDVNGNSIKITYTKDQGSLFPLTIEYGGNDDAGKTIAHPFKVTFGLELRSDPKVSYRRGVREWLEKQVSSIQIETKSAPNGSFSVTRTYTLTYDPSPSFSRSLLKEVAGDLLPKHSFDYLGDSHSPTFSHTLGDSFPFASQKIRESSAGGEVFRTMMDANGDGFSDLIHANSASNLWQVRYGGTNGLVGSSVSSWTFSSSNVFLDDRMERINNETVQRTPFDVTGDGILDWVDADHQAAWDVYEGACVDDSGSFACSFATTATPYTGTAFKYTAASTGTGQKVMMLDMNGDSIQDQVTADQVSGTWVLKVFFGTDTGFEAVSHFNWPASFDRDRVSHNDGGGTDRALVDFNADGLPDFLERLSASNLSVHLNTGTSFVAHQSLTLPQGSDPAAGDNAYVTRVTGTNDTRADFLDLNGDQLPDRVYWDGTAGTVLRVQINLGTDLRPVTIPWTSLVGPIRKANGRGKTDVDMLDWNGDGLLDWLDARADPWLVKVSSPGGKPNAMTVARNGLGGEIRVKYEPSTSFDNTGTVDDNVPFPTWLVTKVRRSDGTCNPPAGEAGFDPAQNSCIQDGNELFQDITYVGAYFDPVERESRGFRVVEVRRPEKIEGATVVYSLTKTTFDQAKHTAGRKLSEERRTSEGTLVQQEDFVWSTRLNSAGDRAQVWRTEHRFERPALAGGTDSVCRLERNEPPSTSNPYNQIETSCSRPCTTSLMCGSPSAGQLTTRTVWKSFPSGAAESARDRPESIVTCDGTAWNSGTQTCNSAGLLVRKDYQYNALANLNRTDTSSGSTVAPNPSTVTVLQDPDEYGNTKSVTDGRGNKTSYDFTTGFKLHPANESRPRTGPDVNEDEKPDIEHNTLADYALAYGAITKVTGENLEETNRLYDGLGRLVCEALPGDSCADPRNATRRIRYQYAKVEGVDGTDLSFEDRLSYVEVLQRQCTEIVSGQGDCVAGQPAKGFSKVRIYVDALGRERATVAERVVGGALKRVTEKHVRFDIAARVAKRYSTYELATAGEFPEPPSPGARTSLGLADSFPPPASEPPVNTTTYFLNGSTSELDPLDRPREMARPGNEEKTTYTYRGTETITDGPGDATLSLKMVSVADDFGQEVRRDLYKTTGTIGLTYQYVYDAMGRLKQTKVGPVATSVTTKTITYDMFDRPVQVVDVDSGTWISGYDAAGNLVVQDDPNTLQHVESCFDVLNRITRRMFVTGGGGYGTAPCTGALPSGTESSYAYDRALDGITAVPFGIGRLTFVDDIPGDESFEYDNRGRITVQKRKVSGTATMRMTYDAGGHLQILRYPDQEQVKYHYQHDGQPNRVESVSKGVDYAEVVHYDLFGRVSRVDHGNDVRDDLFYFGKEKNFRLERILVQGPGTPLVEYVDISHRYNPIGKLEGTDDGRNLSGDLSTSYNWTYDAAGRVTLEDWIPDTTYDSAFEYDTHGNLKKKDSRTLVYDPAKIHQVMQHGDPTATPPEPVEVNQVDYDDNGQRTQKYTVDTGRAEVYAYNHLGQLTRTSYGTSPSSTPDYYDYQYDYAGQRVYKRSTVGGVVGPILAVFSRYADWDAGQGRRTKYYFLGDRLIAARQTVSAFTESQPTIWLARGALPEPLVFAVLGLVGLLLVAPSRRRARLLAPARAGAVIVVFVGSSWPTRAAACSDPPPPPDSVTHYHLDRLGSVLAITDGANGSLLRQDRYKAYGDIRGRFDGSGTLVAENERYRHEYTGWQTDVGTSLLYAGARFYDPALGQFNTHDPVSQFASPYALSPSDPLNTADPTGAQAEEENEVDTAEAGSTEVKKEEGEGGARTGDSSPNDERSTKPEGTPSAEMRSSPDERYEPITAASGREEYGDGRSGPFYNSERERYLVERRNEALEEYQRGVRLENDGLRAYENADLLGVPLDEAVASAQSNIEEFQHYADQEGIQGPPSLGNFIDGASVVRIGAYGQMQAGQNLQRAAGAKMQFYDNEIAELRASRGARRNPRRRPIRRT